MLEPHPEETLDAAAGRSGACQCFHAVVDVVHSDVADHMISVLVSQVLSEMETTACPLIMKTAWLWGV